MSNNHVLYTKNTNTDRYDSIQMSSSVGQQEQLQLVPTVPMLTKNVLPKNSISHPINISWIIPSDVLSFLSVTDFPDEYDLYDFLNPYNKEQRLKMDPQPLHQQNTRIKGNLCLSSCPGKKVRLSGPVRGRAAINRDLDMDFDRMKSFGITMLVCCLDDEELDFLGAPWPKYEMAAKAHNMTVIRLPMVDGGCPRTLSEVRNAVDQVNVEISKGNNVLAHCRGGVGRAGLFAGCWLLENLLCRSVERAVAVLRDRRSTKAIETYNQVEYLIRYSMALKHRLGIPFRKSTTADLSNDSPYKFQNGTPSIPFIARLENLVLVDPALIRDDYSPRTQPPSIIHPVATAAASTTAASTSDVYAPQT